MNFRIQPISAWFEELLGTDWEMWYDLTALFIAVLLLIGLFLLLRVFFRTINNCLQSSDGWRPVCWPMALWSAVTWLALLWCANSHQSGGSEGFLILGIATVGSFFGMVYYHVKNLRIIKGIGALGCNILTGLIILPLAQLGIIAAVILAVLAIAILLVPTRIVYYR